MRRPHDGPYGSYHKDRLYRKSGSRHSWTIESGNMHSMHNRQNGWNLERLQPFCLIATFMARCDSVHPPWSEMKPPYQERRDSQISKDKTENR
jgi:hypothetical protein